METELEKIKIDKIKEAELLFETIGITQGSDGKQYLSEIPTFYENSKPKKEEVKFYWTRLSINSNSSNVIE